MGGNRQRDLEGYGGYSKRYFTRVSAELIYWITRQVSGVQIRTKKVHIMLCINNFYKRPYLLKGVLIS